MASLGVRARKTFPHTPRISFGLSPSAGQAMSVPLDSTLGSVQWWQSTWVRLRLIADPLAAGEMPPLIDIVACRCSSLLP